MIRGILNWWDRHNTMWRCPVCGKLKRTLTKTRLISPTCLHRYSPYNLYGPSKMRRRGT